MEIRRKITLLFILIVAFILLLSSLSIYIAFSKSQTEEFYFRLDSKARMVAQMLIDIDEIDADLLKKIEKNNPMSLPNEKIIIYDNSNKKLFSNDEDSIFHITTDLINKVRQDENFRFKQNNYEVLGINYTSGLEQIVVFVGATNIFGINKLKKLRIILLVVFIISLFIVYFAGHLFSSHSLNPISSIINQVSGISVLNLNERLEEGNGKDELAHLARSFNRMLERLEQAFNLQKNFIANASHELRTPLTVITGQLEVELFKTRTNEEYQATLNSVLDEIRNINLLANRLLLLAQTSSDFEEVNFNLLRIDDILWTARKELLKRNQDYSIHINFSKDIADEKILILSGNPLLIKTAIINLMDNACKYSLDHQVHILVDDVNNNLQLQFKDKGIGIPEEDIEMIFQPFYRSKNAFAIKGHGIGLSLVKNIIILHKGKVEVQSKLDEGTIFKVTFLSQSIA